MKKLLWPMLLVAGQMLAQSITIPAQKVTVTINARKYTITIPAQTVNLPASTLPSGLKWTPASGTTPGILAVAGNVLANAVLMTGGPTLPTSANGLYLLQMQTTGFLTPVPYVPIMLPALTQSGENTFTTP